MMKVSWQIVDELHSVWHAEYVFELHFCVFGWVFQRNCVGDSHTLQNLCVSTTRRKLFEKDSDAKFARTPLVEIVL